MRRLLLIAALLASTSLGLSPTAWADAAAVTRSTGLTILGTPSLPADFKAFPYVNPDAPKGGQVVLGIPGTYDNFNPFILRGVGAWGLVGPWIAMAGGAGSGSSVGHVWESLLTASADEIETAYGHLAQTVEIPADKMWVAFEIRPEAHFSDGTPVTAEDVVWTFETLRDHGRPSFAVSFSQVKDVVAENPHRVVFHFTTNENRELPMLVGGIPVLPKHYFANRDFEAPLTDAPVGSGPYIVKSFDLGRSITYQRDPNWWARDMPTGRGTNNFDTVRVDFYRDATADFEAFKAGSIDIRSENISKNWATAYDFPAVQNGQVIKQAIPHHLPTGLQGFAMNSRRKLFQNPLTRAAFGQLLDFEWIDKNLFYGAYTRTGSYFSNSDLAATGLPDAAEQTLLAPYRDSLPPELFTKPFVLPVTDGSGNNRDELRAALSLFQQAGWTVKDRKLVDADGNQMSVTILADDPSIERIELPFVESMKKLGIDAQVRTVDPSQYQKLTDDFDFDITIMIYSSGDIPGTELRDEWSCASAKATGSDNVTGTCDPAVDALVEDVIKAQDRDTLRAAARALDRVLLWRWYTVPTWDNTEHRIAYWDKFGRPATPIREGFNFDLWWVDPAKAAKLDAARKG